MKNTIKTPEQLYFSKDHEMVRKAVKDFVIKELDPNADEWEEKKISPLHDIFKKMGELGFIGIRYDEKYGGEGLDYMYELVMLEEISHCKTLGVPMAISVQTGMATPAIYEFGSEYLKKTYLKKALKGEFVASIAVTEPNAGSDVGAVSTFAQKDGDSYILNGTKTFITNGTQADIVITLARTSEKPGYHAFSLFVVPTDLPGFNVSKKLDKLGMHSSDTAELFYDNVRVPAENLIGEEGEGFIYQMNQFQHERFVVLPMAYIICEDMIKMTVEYIKERIVFGKPLMTKQVLQHRLVGYLTEIECLKQLTYHIVRMKMAGLDATKEITMGKLYAGQMVTKVAEGCIQMFGGMGFMNEMLISRYYRDIRVLPVGGGASEVMSDVLAKIEGYK